MEEDLRMLGQPGVTAFVITVVVQDDMDFASAEQLAKEPVHELQKLDASLTRGSLAMNGSGRGLQGHEQIERAMMAVCPS
jgi:hypothetical protein